MKKYWLRGGIIGISIGIVILIIHFVQIIINPGTQSAKIFAIYFIHPSITFSEIFPIYIPGSLPLTVILHTTILGVFLGWFYGKIKKQNKLN